jgi:hypothetical protein
MRCYLSPALHLGNIPHILAFIHLNAQGEGYHEPPTYIDHEAWDGSYGHSLRVGGILSLLICVRSLSLLGSRC